NLVAYVALFFSLGLGTAWALERNSVKSKHIVNGQVKSVDVANDETGDALTGTDVAPNTITRQFDALQRALADGKLASETRSLEDFLGYKDAPGRSRR
ncbi:MAG TPA: hypothetical protein VGX52_06235, partial [Burkholderiales bacterium]|nr:hypothetical protein [Burkholderiales bacterium]